LLTGLIYYYADKKYGGAIMHKLKNVTVLVIVLVLLASCALPAAAPAGASADSGAVLYLALGVHVEPFGAVPSQLVGGGRAFTGQGVRPLDYHDKGLLARHISDIQNLAVTAERHGARLTVQVQTPFTSMLAQGKSTLLTDLEKKGHEVALHFHEDAHLGKNCGSLPVPMWSAVMSEEAAVIKQAGASKVRTWSGGNLYSGLLDAAAGAGLSVYSDWKNPKSQAADTTTFGLQPWRPADGPDPDNMGSFAKNDPDGKIVFLPWGLSSTGGLFGPGKGKADAMFATLKNSIDLSLSKAVPDKVNVFHFVVHPGEITGLNGAPTPRWING